MPVLPLAPKPRERVASHCQDSSPSREPRSLPEERYETHEGCNHLEDMHSQVWVGDWVRVEAPGCSEFDEMMCSPSQVMYRSENIC